MRRRGGALALFSDAFFYGYTGTCVVAGATGAAFANADVDLISGFRPHDQLPERAAATVLSQHRFLRAMEMGFGLFSLHERERIHRERSSNRLFLSLMASGVAARALARGVDGRPRANAYVFGGSELLGLALIFAHTRTTLHR